MIPPFPVNTVVLGMVRDAPLLMVTTFAPRDTTPEGIVTEPSSTVMFPAVCVPLTLRLKDPDASVPAEKTALRPAVHPAVAAVPSRTVLQKVLVPQVPVGVVPAPAVVPLLSQYRSVVLPTVYWKTVACPEVVNGLMNSPLLAKISGPPPLCHALMMYRTTVPAVWAGRVAVHTSVIGPPPKVQEKPPLTTIVVPVGVPNAPDGAEPSVV